MEDSVASPLQPYGEGDTIAGIRTLAMMWYDEVFSFLNRRVITCDDDLVVAPAVRKYSSQARKYSTSGAVGLHGCLDAHGSFAIYFVSPCYRIFRA